MWKTDLYIMFLNLTNEKKREEENENIYGFTLKIKTKSAIAVDFFYFSCIILYVCRMFHVNFKLLSL